MKRTFDFKLDKNSIEYTPSGAMKVSAYLSRTGTQDYFIAGKKVTEYRPPSEVFSKNSLNSYISAPITEFHPKNKLVDSTNWKELSRGHVESVDVEDSYVAGKLVITDKDTQEKILAGELKELSCGYYCDVVSVDNKDYSFEQKNIIINHIALLPEGMARGGSNLKVHLDWNESEVEMEEQSIDIKIDETGAEEKSEPETIESVIIEPETKVDEAVDNLSEVKTQIKTVCDSLGSQQKMVEEIHQMLDQLVKKMENEPVNDSKQVVVVRNQKQEPEKTDKFSDLIDKRMNHWR